MAIFIFTPPGRRSVGQARRHKGNFKASRNLKWTIRQLNPAILSSKKATKTLAPPKAGPLWSSNDFKSDKCQYLEAYIKKANSPLLFVSLVVKQLKVH